MHIQNTVWRRNGKNPSTIRSPHLDHFVPFPGFPGTAEQFFDAPRGTNFFADMQAERFDLAIQLHGSGVYSNPFTSMLGARWTVGFVRPDEPAGLLDVALPMPAKGHERDRLLAMSTFCRLRSGLHRTHREGQRACLCASAWSRHLIPAAS